MKLLKNFCKLVTLLPFVAAGFSAIANTNIPESRPNIVWISCEDMSPLLGCYGSDYATTPEIDRFAKGSTVYQNAWSTMPICAPARSTLITGRYATSLGSMNLRSQVRQSEQVEAFPVLLRRAGYFCTNNQKTDYNFSAKGVWDQNGSDAHWRNRKDPKQPFFHVVNYTKTHEGHTQRYEETPYIASSPHDPEKAVLPPHFPDTPVMRKIWAHHHDLITELDAFVGDVLNELEADGLRENTIIFFFSDHGSGLPRYKRWLYQPGLHVPLIVHVPDAYKEWAGSAATDTDRLVGFVDFGPSVLSLAGVDIPEKMQGVPFMGGNADPAPRYQFGARDRADDLEDLSRCVRDERYLYIRNYMPFRPYIRDAAIFTDQKASAGVMRDEMKKENPHPQVVRMFKPKPFEELYDLENDPNELHNLAADPQYAKIKNRLKGEMERWILSIRDAAFLPEGEMMRRGVHDSVYDMAQDPLRYDLDTLLAAADRSSDPTTSLEELLAMADNEKMGVRYWSACGLLARSTPDTLYLKPTLERLMEDENPQVATVAAEALIRIDENDSTAFEKLLSITSIYIDTEPAIALRSARALAESGAAVKPYLAQVQNLSSRVSGPVWGRYRNWLYPMFIGMSLDMAQMNAGVKIDRYQ